MKKQIFTCLIVVVSTLLSSCSKVYEKDAFKVTSKRVDVASLKDDSTLYEKAYIKRSFELGQFIKLPDWASDLKGKDCKIPYAINTYTDYKNYKDFATNILGCENIFINNTQIKENTLFDTHNILAIARRVDSTKNSYDCDYLNFKTISNKNYIDARYYTRDTTYYHINFIIDVIAIEKDFLSVNNINNKLIIKQNYYYDSNESFRKAPSKPYSSMHVKLDNYFDRYDSYKFFDDYDKFKEYTNNFTDIKIDDFVDESWFDNHKALVIYKNSPNLAVLNYYDVKIKNDEMTLSCFVLEGSDVSATYRYIDIVFIKNSDIPGVDVDKEYNVKIKNEFGY